MSKWIDIRNTHPNSVSAYYDGLLRGLFSKREDLIMGALRMLNKGTDKEISDHLGFHHKSAVQPRITELINEAGLLEECGHKYDDVTGKSVRIVRIIENSEDPRQLKLF